MRGIVMDENLFDEVLPILQAGLFVSLIEERIDEDEYGRLCRLYRLDSDKSLYCCAVFHTSIHQVPQGVKPKQFVTIVEREIKEKISEELKCKEFIYIGNIVLIIEMDSQADIGRITDICDRICKEAYTDINAVVTAGIGKSFDNLYEISESYESAMEAVSCRTLYGTMRAINIDDRNKGARKSTSMRLVEKAKNIVEDRYMEPGLSLDTICSALGVSNSYFSAVFKRETGKPFITYLTDYRLDIALEMIKDTNEKNYKIAERVGYLDANYFSYVFKRRFGVSPSKYKI
jgi:YesN/AraC family two-component response regulator